MWFQDGLQVRRKVPDTAMEAIARFVELRPMLFLKGGGFLKIHSRKVPIRAYPVAYDLLEAVARNCSNGGNELFLLRIHRFLRMFSLGCSLLVQFFPPALVRGERRMRRRKIVLLDR